MAFAAPCRANIKFLSGLGLPSRVRYFLIMDSLSFVKMTGAGNDFVVVDNRSLGVNLTREQIAALCHRHFGVGADGLLAAEPADRAGADFRMRYYNADGGEAEMCGNGARCFARFIQPWSRAEPGRVRFLTQAGLITGEYVDHEIRVNLTAPTDFPKREPKAPISARATSSITSSNTGVPHVVIEVDDVEVAEVCWRWVAPFATANFSRAAPTSISSRSSTRRISSSALTNAAWKARRSPAEPA